MKDEERHIYCWAINKWGKPLQVVVCIEEMAELTKVLSKYLRNPDLWMREDFICSVAEEIADVEIMLDQMKIVFANNGRVQGYRVSKIDRLKQRVEDTEAP